MNVVDPRAMVAWASATEMQQRGRPYGDAELTHLLGGSGGGGGNDDPGGGGGGGAIELIAHGDGVLSLTASAKISVNGGDADIDDYQSGGAGSGGAIRLEGGSISCTGNFGGEVLAILC